ncbi:MAG: bifunctional hydroxymethylpyrimidine kinase/phosphomethylpyrimidine kinase [Planctomycetota bacterium]
MKPGGAPPRTPLGLPDRPRVLLLGGLDPSGGAGLTADARVLSWHDVDDLPVALSLTVQSRLGFEALDRIPTRQWRRALEAVLEEGPVRAVKIGLLADSRQVEDVAAALGGIEAPIVVDPILASTAGGLRHGRDMALALRRRLLPIASLATPNRPEFDALCGGEARLLLEEGCRAVLVKGGHGSEPSVVDVYHGSEGTRAFEHARSDVGDVHGTGCAYASAAAAALALGAELPAACERASEFLSLCLCGMGPPPSDGLPRRLRLPSAASRR